MHRRTLDSNNKISLETFEGEESVIRNSKSNDREDNGQKKRVKTSNGWQNTTQRRKMKQQELHQKPDWTQFPGRLYIVLLLDDTNIACYRYRVRHEFY